MKLKNKFFLKLLLTNLLTITIILPAYSQCETRNNAFKAGEIINYDLYFNWKFVWVKCGSATMKTTASKWQSKPAYRTFLITRGNNKADMFFRMRDTLISIIGANLTPYYYYKGSYEGKRYYEDEAYYSYRNGSVYVRQRKLRKGKNTITQNTSSHCVYDMLSILAQARSYNPQSFKVGQKIHFQMVTGSEIETQTLIYRGKKNIKAENDTTYRCLVFSFVESKGRKEKEIVTFFVSDDDNHLPIRLDMYLNFGSAKAFLNNVRGYRHPMNSIVSR